MRRDGEGMVNLPGRERPERERRRWGGGQRPAWPVHK